MNIANSLLPTNSVKISPSTIIFADDLEPLALRACLQNIPAEETLPNGAKQGITDFRRVGYGGPCPPSGTHRYFFKIYCVDKTLDLPPRSDKAALLKAMDGHVLTQGQLMGKYKRQ